MKTIAQFWYWFVIAALMVATDGQARAGEPERYAELRTDSAGKSQVLIRADVWQGVFTVHGYGGYARNIYYWTTLQGDGPEYSNPVLNVNGLSSEQFVHRGTIMVDRKNKRVVIDLDRLVSKHGEPEKLEPSPANGTYRIKRITKDPFMKPE